MNNYANILDNLEEMERFLDACMIPRLSTEWSLIESVNNNLPTNKNTRPPT